MSLSALQSPFKTYCDAAQTEREKGAYVEELIITYPLELLLRVVTVSLETMKIVNALPELAIYEAAKA